MPKILGIQAYTHAREQTTSTHAGALTREQSERVIGEVVVVGQRCQQFVSQGGGQKVAKHAGLIGLVAGAWMGGQALITRLHVADAVGWRTVVSERDQRFFLAANLGFSGNFVGHKV